MTATNGEVLRERYGFDQRELDEMHYEVRRGLAQFARRQQIAEAKKLGQWYPVQDS